MLIGGLQKFSLLDYPEHISAIVFTQGCNFRCHFCYNPMLVWPPREVGKLNIYSSEINNTGEEIEKVYPQFLEDDLFDFLESRQKKLDAVVITGGEPTIHADLAEFIAKIKKLDFKIKLDTNGTNPRILKTLYVAGLLDYVAMDIKGVFAKYDTITGIQPDIGAARESLKLIMESGLPYEFRTTVVPGLVEKKDIEEIGKEIKGAQKWYLQAFKSDTDLVNSNLRDAKAYTAGDMEKMRAAGAQFVNFCGIR